MKIGEVIINLTRMKKDAPCHIKDFPLVYSKGDRSGCHRKLYPYNGSCVDCRNSNSKDWVASK
jgi:hypothetical protein